MISWDRVRELRDEIGAEDFDEVVGLFFEEADEAIDRLSSSVGAGSLTADLHYLKGAALNLGFQALAALCEDGERRAAASDPAIDLAAVRKAYVDSRAAFAEGRHRVAA